MNERSFTAEMMVVLGCKVFRKPESADAYGRRRDAILTAAEHGFVKTGFHRTTIQSIAADAGMSVGNVYRYFASKDAVVEALVGRDQAKMAQDFDSLAADDLMGSFQALMRRQIIESGRAKAVLWLEICAEAARNPTIAEVTRAHERAIFGHLVAFFTRLGAARAHAGAAMAAEPESLASLVITHFAGLMVTQALSPETAVDAGVDQLLAAVTAAAGAPLPAAADARTRIDA